MSKSTKKNEVEKKPKKTVAEMPEKEEPQNEQDPTVLPMREIIIQTDGHNIKITKNETAGVLELSAILQALLGSLTQKK